MPANVHDRAAWVRFPWLLFGGFSLAAVLTGCWIAGAHGIPGRALALNLAAWVVGAALAVAVARIRFRTLVLWPAIALAGLAATFLAPGLSGVHRWISAGPVRLNSAELLLPSAIVALAVLERRSPIGLLASVAIMALLACQPDGSQAVAFAGGSLVALAAADSTRLRRVLVAGLLAGAAVIASSRPDPLAPVPEVEGIIRLAVALSPLVAALAVLALAGAVLAPLAAAPRRRAAWALTAYLGLCALAPVWGAFPVPLVGMGVSPILGAWLGFGALMAALT